MLKNNFLRKTLLPSVLAGSLLVSFVGCSTRAQGGTLLGAASGAGVGSLIGGGKGRLGAMLGLGLLGALAGNQFFDKEADRSEEERRRRENYDYRRRLEDDWRRDSYRDRDRDYYEYDRNRDYDRRY